MKFFKAILIGLLSWEARLIIRKYKPRIIGLTGNVGKTSAKDAIFTVLEEHFSIRKSPKSYNSEIGVPLAVLGVDNQWKNFLGWLKNLVEGLALIIFHYSYPRWLILEIGVDRPGDIRRTLADIALDVAIITDLPAIPVHVEFFSSPEELIKEKFVLLEAVKSDGLIIINHDNEQLKKWRTLNQKNAKKIKIISYGYGEGADCQITNEHLVYDENGFPLGSNFKINYRGSSLPAGARIYSKEQILNLLPGVIIADQIGLPILKAIDDLAKYRLPPGRLQPLVGLKNSLILDDTYNSSPAALSAALRVLGACQPPPGGRRIAVLGDMLELGNYTIDAHRRAGIEASAVADLLIGVGLRAKFIIDEAVKKHFGRKKVKHFMDARETGKYLERIIQPGDIILVKGSQSIRLERAVEEIMAHPETRHTALCRQETEWTKR